MIEVVKFSVDEHIGPYTHAIHNRTDALRFVLKEMKN
jgi:hypothetical protein